MTTLSRRYCGMCDLWMSARHVECPDCGASTDRADRPPLLVTNVAQRLKERRTRLEDAREAISAVEARKRLLESR